MKVMIAKWGNSAGVRIPVALMDAAKLALGEEAEISAEDGKIVIQPVTRLEFSLAKLVAGITPENCHAEISTGRPVGREIL